MKKKKIIILILALVSLTIFISTTIYTYAKYKTTVDGNMATDIYKWHFKINDEDIVSNNTETISIPISFDNTENAQKLYPGATGTFEIELDYSAVNLDFTYTISIEDNEIIKDLKISKLYYENSDGTQEEITATESDGASIVTGEILATDTPRTKTLMAEVIWNDDEDTEEMNDNEDTKVAYEYGNTEEDITFVVNITLTQKN